MRNLAEKRWSRIAAAALFCVFLLISTAASVVVRYGRTDGWYRTGSNTGFENTAGCEDYVLNGLNYVVENVRWREDLTLTDLGSYAGSAFSYVILDEAGIITADTRTSTSVYVSRLESVLDDSADGVLLQSSFTVEGYVNLPVEPYSGCYAEYVMYDAFFGIRYLMLALKIVFLLLAGLMLLVLCLGAVKRGREGRLRGFMKKSFDIVLLFALVVYICIDIFSHRIIDAFMEDFYVYTGTWPIRVYWSLPGNFSYCFCLIVGSLVLWYMSGQLGAGILTKNLLTRKLLKRIPQPVFILGFFLIHILFLLISFEGLYDELPKLLLLFIDAVAAAILFVNHSQARQISRAAEELAGGDLNYKTNTNKLHFVWKTLGNRLNSIGDGMANAVEARMRSERMKTELITNVSHDLKTPLTSIINYIELLKSDDLQPDTRAEYLSILEKQSARLKKITEDVLEASKAASGAMTLNLEDIDTVELLQQFLGEYTGRFKEAGIDPVLSTPNEEVFVCADCLLLGRVIDNLLTNVVKYAQPGTRAYIDLWREGEMVRLTVKNTSRDPLNISADELMERFVRGDSARHSEGSGLGLSIARSLTELMGGRLMLVLDGDLFKAEIDFPAMDVDNNNGAVE